MRIIKFRAWEIKKKRWFLDWFSISKDGNKIYDGDAFEYDLADFELMQFTGLQDKSGADIYECDIVELFGGGSVPSIKAEISINLCGVHFNTMPYWANNFRSKDMGVIGNKWENPELLEKKL